MKDYKTNNMKEFSEDEIYDIDQKFREALKKEEARQKTVFYRALMTVLVLMLIAAFIGYICA